MRIGTSTPFAIALNRLARCLDYRMLVVAVCTTLFAWLTLPSRANADEFTPSVASVFKVHCVKCHGAEESQGGLRLDRYSFVMQGGDSGAVVVAKQSVESELWKRVTATERSQMMPPEGARLNEDELASIKKWIDGGATGPTPEVEQQQAEAEDRVRREHWAWKPLVAPATPSIKSQSTRSMIDLFVQAKLQTIDLVPSPEADRATLIRRLYFDLLGLPPAPDQVQRFVADTSPDAYERLVDQLLSSPRYGERWARHWLDVVHYGDTHGYDKDKPRMNAWPYRDYVIRSFNSDRPYSQFIEQQLAGDALGEQPSDNIEALGFISAGPWDFIGHAEVPETKTDGKIARHLDRDDMVANTIGTFCSVTIHCAQCHNHKFDPFTQADYYGLQAVFAAIDRTDRPYYPDPVVAIRVQEAEAKIKRLQATQEQLNQAIRQIGSEALVSRDAEVAKLTSEAIKHVPPQYGYHSQIDANAKSTKWVQVDLGNAHEISKIVLHPCFDDFNGIGPGFGFPESFTVLACDDSSFQSNVRTVYRSTVIDSICRGIAPLEIDASRVNARYIRIVADELAVRQNDYIFALNELQVFGTGNENLALNKPVQSLDSIEAPERWAAKNVVDGITATGEHAARLAELRRQKHKELTVHLTPEQQRLFVEIEKAIQFAKEERASLPQPQMVYVGAVHTGSGAFRGTGADGGKPRPIYLLARGNVLQPGPEMAPAAIGTLPGISGDLGLQESSNERDRRLALARWISSKDNPLTWRSIANRLWQYHFGNGLVETANDFGRMGGKPSHPELLDWMAVQIRDHEGSIKTLHREIVLSHTYRQRSDAEQAKASGIDANNLYLWKQNRRKLDAESIRDAILVSSNAIDYRMGGPGFQDFVVEHPEHSPHYEYDLADPNNAATFRRSIYRFIVRSQTQPFMTLLDCADPSSRVEKRNETVSATQVLTLLNNGFMAVQAKRFADRIDRLECRSDLERASQAFEIAIGHKPTEEQAAQLVQFAKQFGWPNAARLLFNLNEFAFVD